MGNVPPTRRVKDSDKPQKVPVNPDDSPGIIEPKVNDANGSLKTWVAGNKQILIPLLFVLVIFIILFLLPHEPGAVVKKSLLFQNPAPVKQAGPAEDPNYKINFEFAKYNLTNTPFKPSVPDYSVSISDLYNVSNFEQSTKKQFSDGQKSALVSSNFFIDPNTDKFWNDDLEQSVEGSGRMDDWSGLYGTIGGGSECTRAPENSVFVSTDYVLHIYHRLLEKEFEYIENKNLYPALRAITDAVLARALQDYPGQTDPESKSSYERIIAFFAVPKSILDASAGELTADSTADQKLDTDETILKNLDGLKRKLPDVSYQKARAELQLILEAKTITPSPLFDEFLSKAGLQSPVDYTQFTPRSHYNKNSILRSYFRAMMWYGRSNFPLISPELTRDALNISLLMKSTGQLKNWETIYIPTAFLVGKSDDLGIYEYNTSLQKIGAGTVNTDTVSKVQEDMKNYQGPQIQSSVFAGLDVFGITKSGLLDKTKGFRFMGQRFTPDAFIFTALTQGDEKSDPVTGQKLPSSTTALMVMSALGNKTSDPFVQNWISANAPDSDKVLNNTLKALKDQFAKISSDVWNQNIYWAWLYTIKSLYTGETDKTGYPMFMKNDAWSIKSLLSSLGSWTELKHDTLLYAKQTYAEFGGGGGCTPPPVPKGYVEPNIPFFDRLIALIDMTNHGLQSRNLIGQEFTSRNESFSKELQFYKDIAVKEIQNEKISDDEFEKLRTSPGALGRILDALPGEELHEKDARSALIADVQTDVKKSQVLYEADGIPNYLYVAVKDQNGSRLTKGLVFNYYEFNAPIGKRLTDQDWWTMNYTPDKTKLPVIPSWSQSLYK